MKQIVGGTLTQDGVSLRTNFVSDRGAAWYADLYRRDGLSGGHVIKLGPGNDHVAREALAAWPGGLQVGGGMTPENAEEILRQEVGAVFMQVLEDAGVYKCTPEGRRAFLRFVQSV